MPRRAVSPGKKVKSKVVKPKRKVTQKDNHLPLQVEEGEIPSEEEDDDAYEQLLRKLKDKRKLEGKSTEDLPKTPPKTSK